MNYTQADIEAVILKLDKADVETAEEQLKSLRGLIQPLVKRAHSATAHILGLGAPLEEAIEINLATGVLIGLMLNNNEEWIAAPSADQKLDQFIRVVAAMGNA